MRLQHFARGAGILAIGFVVKIAPARGRDVQQTGECDGDDKKRMARRWRLERLWLDQSFLNGKCANAGDHDYSLAGRRRRSPVDIFPILPAAAAILHPASR